jgi:hypothetical protein
MRSHVEEVAKALDLVVRSKIGMKLPDVGGAGAISRQTHQATTIRIIRYSKLSTCWEACCLSNDLGYSLVNRVSYSFALSSPPLVASLLICTLPVSSPSPKKITSTVKSSRYRRL